MDLLKRVNKIPAGTMLVPLFTAAVLNTFCPSILRIGSYSQSLISNDGINVMMFLTLLFTGTQIKIKDIPEALKRGGSHVFFKYLAGTLAYFIILKFFGYNGIFGTCTLAILCALTNNNSSLYMGLVQNYGDHADLAARPIFNFNSGPILTLLTIGVSGGNAVSWEEYVTVLIPLLIGIILSAIDEKIKTATKNGITLILPVMGFILGSGIDLSKIIVSGFGGVFLFILVLIITGPVALFVDRILLKRPGYGGMATVSVAGNTIAVPAMIGQFVPAFRDYVNLATVQISCAVVLSSIICPLIVRWFAKHFGCPKYKEVFQKMEIS